MISYNDLAVWCGSCLLYAFAIACLCGVAFLLYVFACVILEMLQKQARAAKITKQYISYLRFRRRYNKRAAIIEKPKARKSLKGRES